MGKSLRDRATREWSLLHVSTLRASVAFAALLLAGCESRVERHRVLVCKSGFYALTVVDANLPWQTKNGFEGVDDDGYHHFIKDNKGWRCRNEWRERRA